jgi:hypothetical protein
MDSGGVLVQEQIQVMTEVLYIGYVGMIREELANNKYPFPLYQVGVLSEHVEKMFCDFTTSEDFLPRQTFFKVMSDVYEKNNKALLNSLIHFAYEMMPRAKNKRKTFGGKKNKYVKVEKPASAD